MTRSDDMVVLTKLENAVEAQALTDLLTSEGIPHAARSYDVGVLPGVRGNRAAWGEVRVPASMLARARELLAEFDSSRVEEAELERQAMSARRLR